MFAFPGIPGSHASRYGIRHLQLRPFGRAPGDIEIDFQQPLRPYLVTQVLQCCTIDGTDSGSDFFWDLPLSKRIEALLAIATSGGVENLTLQFRCSRQTCAELIEVELSMEEIVQLQPPDEHDTGFRIPVNGTDCFFRKPTGSDQLHWLEASFADEDEAAAAMIRTLWVSPPEPELPLDPKNIETIDEGMKEMDPLVHFNITVCCPLCSEKSACAVDLEDFLLRRLHKVQQGLLYDIHCLASSYHWSEGQILALSPRRRAYYLSLIDSRDKKGTG